MKISLILIFVLKFTIVKSNILNNMVRDEEVEAFGFVVSIF